MMSWKSLSRLISGIRGAYNDINPSTLTGAIDIIVIEQPDGSFTSGPFHVRFGKLTALAPADKIVEIYVNGIYVDFIQMRLGSAGDAYFVDTDDVVGVSEHNSEAHVPPASEMLLPPHWRSGMLRRRRRRARRDTACSEPDSSQRDFEYLDDQWPQSDVEDLSPRSAVPHYASDSMLADGLTSSEHFDWATWEQYADRSTETANPPADPAENKLEPSTPNSQKLDGVYLEDLVSEVDPVLKETYIYPPVHGNPRNSTSPNRRVPGEVAAQSIDAGYRSDGEQSPRSLSPIYPNISGLRLSLCGCPAVGTSLSDEKFFENLVSYEEFIEDPVNILSNPNLTVCLNGKYLNWQVAAPSIISILAYQTELPHRTVRRLEDLHMRKKEVRRSSWFSWGARATEPSSEKPSSTVSTLEQVTEVLPSPPETSETADHSHSSESPTVDEKSDSGPGRKCNRLSSEDIARLGLKPGRNDVEYRLTTRYQGTCICSASIFVWHWTDRIIISDVDGTITRSDVLGHLLPMLGHDWTHSGVARLYNQIAHNGYRFVYLSARALGQAGITRSYLRQLVQENTSLPDGPILLSPSSLLHALHQEVIEKKPEIFKIRCLKDVCALFPTGCCPFYAGFGNKANDVHAYEKAGIQLCRIFTINPRGEVRNEFQPNKITSYIELSEMVDHYFPVIDTSSRTAPDFDSNRENASTDSEHDHATATLEPSNEKPIVHTPVDLSLYSSFTYWRPVQNEESLSGTVEHNDRLHE